MVLAPYKALRIYGNNQRGQNRDDVSQLSRDEIEAELLAAREGLDAIRARHADEPDGVTQRVPPPNEEESYPQPANVTDITADDIRLLLKVSADDWNDIRCGTVHDVLAARLDWDLRWAIQRTRKIDKAINAINATFPFLRRFQNSWVTRWFIKTYWKSRQDYARRKRQGKAKSRKNWVENSEWARSRGNPHEASEPPGDHDDGLDNNHSPPISSLSPSPHNPPGDNNDDEEDLEPYHDRDATPPPPRNSLKRLQRGSDQPPAKRYKTIKRVIEEQVPVSDDEEGEEDDWVEGEAGPSSLRRR